MTVRVVDTEELAANTYQTFMDRKHRRKQTMKFGWPEKMQEVGIGKAVMYRSNKWKLDAREWEDYKHVAEATQTLYVTPGFLREWGDPRKKMPVDGPIVSFEEPMPKHFAILAPLIGIQARLYEKRGKTRRLGDPYEIVIARAMLGGAHHPETNEPFLFVYTRSGGVHMLLTGPELDIEKDGIVG